jgi:hypothetical protein
MRFLATACSAALLALLPLAASAQPTFEGFLCCNMRSDGNWISDINYMEGGKRVVPLGTPAKVTGYGRYRVLLQLGGSSQAIGNDYSRDMDLGTFAARYIVKQDPKQKLAGYSAAHREAITSGRIMRGMTREQVIMAVGYPVSSENPSLDANIWRFWRDSFNEFQVHFDDQGRVKEISTDAMTRNLVVKE